MLIKIFTTALMVIVVFMGFKQGLGMFNGEKDIMEMFGKWNFGREGVRLFGILTLLSTLMIIFPQTYFLGNLLMGASIFAIICLQISVADFKGAAIELPFILMNLVLIYFQYPINRK